MRTNSRILPLLIFSVGTTLAAACQGTPTGPCGGTLFPDVPVRRVTVVDQTGRSLDSSVSLALRAQDGTTGPGVAVLDLYRIDPTGTKGRGAMRLLVSAPGFRSTEVTLLQVCVISPPPVTVTLMPA